MPRQPPLARLLQELDKEELIAEILKLAERFEVVKTYFAVELSGDATPALDKARKAITRQFQTAKGQWRPEPKASALNRIVRDFERISIFKSDVAALLVHRVNETLRWASNAYTPTAALTNSTELAMEKARKLIAEEGLEATLGADTADWNNPNWRYGKAADWLKPAGGWWTW